MGGDVMTYPYHDTDNGHMTVFGQSDVSNDNGDGGYRWLKVILLKLPSGAGGFATFAFLVPQLAAEGNGFANPQQAMATACKLILSAVLVLVGLFA